LNIRTPRWNGRTQTPIPFPPGRVSFPKIPSASQRSARAVGGDAIVQSDRAGAGSCSRILELGAPLQEGELPAEGEILQSQPRAVPEEGTEEQEDDSEDGHLGLHLR